MHYLDNWRSRLDELSTDFQTAKPYRHVIMDDFLPSAIALELESAFPKPNSKEWINYKHVNEYKFGKNDIDEIPDALQKIIEFFNSDEMLSAVSEISGIPDLIADPMLEGGGLHQTPRGGFLNVHADFTAHPKQKLWRRRINLLLYLNSEWEEEFGGHLELWDKEMSTSVQRVLPIINRLVIFNTDENSFHGHPDPLNCPEDRTRKSIAIYYYTEESNFNLKATRYVSRPGDSLFQSFMIGFDDWLLKFYSFLRRKLGLNDKVVSRILALFSSRTS